jgi:iron complex transport system permease protein
MGNLHNATWDKLRDGAVPMVLGVTGLMVLSWRHNLLALGDDETRSAGLNPFHLKLVMVFFATLAASGAVSVAGIIGFVGLVLPHMVRIMTGPDNKIMLPSSFFFGGSFLLLIDTLSRTFTSFEIPIGIFTMILGGPLFIMLLKRSKIGWEVS